LHGGQALAISILFWMPLVEAQHPQNPGFKWN